MLTFPVETEASIRRRILDICRDQTRNVVEITRELALMTDSVGEGKGKDAKDHYQNMVKILDDFEGTKKKVDTAYRSLDLEVLDEKIPLRTLLLIRDLSAHMENMADLGVDVVDLIRVIALTA